jgi:hypothetical protein
MAEARKLFLAVVFLFLTLSAKAQTVVPPGSGGAPATVFAQVVNAQAGNNPLLDVSLTGNVALTNASGTTSGTVTLTAFSRQWSGVDLQLPTGEQSEIRNGSGLYHSRTWTGSDGVAHKAAFSDMKLPHPAWFFPSFVLLSGLGSPNYWSADLGTQTWEGSTVHHIAIWQRIPSSLSAAAVALAQKQTQADFYLDPTTFLPIAMTFHVADPQNPYEIVAPQNTSGNDVLVEVQFSDYRILQGRQIPYHIRVLNGSSPSLDISISSATINANETAAVTN